MIGLTSMFLICLFNLADKRIYKVQPTYLPILNNCKRIILLDIRLFSHRNLSITNGYKSFQKLTL